MSFKRKISYAGRTYRPSPRGYSRARAQGKAMMPYQRGYLRRGGFYGRFNVGGRYRGGPNGGGGELKFFDLDLDKITVATAGTLTDSINKIPQGTTEITRIGRKCVIKKIGWKWEATKKTFDAQAIASVSDSIRIMMYLDKQANGATAAVTDILEDADFQSFNNLANSGRFRILYDKQYVMNSVSLASDNAAVVSSQAWKRRGSFYKNCNIPIEFSGVAGAMGEIRSNNIGVILITENAQVDFTSKIRIRFTDS